MAQFSLKRQFGGYVLEAQSTLRAAGKPTTVAEKRFVLFGRGRSGSTLLVQMLDANPDIGCLDEILRFKTLRPVQMIDRELGQLPKPIRGFKLLSYQVRDLHARQADPLRAWMADPDVTIFHLRRENILRHALSNIYAKSRRAYHSTDRASEAQQKIHIDPDTIMQWMQGSLDLLEWEKRYLGDLARENICYERDLSTPEAQAETLDRVSRSLGVATQQTSAPLKKVTPQEYDAFIENWHALRAAITASPFRSYLDMAT